MVLAVEMICSQCVCPLKGRKLMALAHALLNQIAFSPLLLCSHSHAGPPVCCLPMLVLWIYTVQHCFFISFLWEKALSMVLLVAFQLLRRSQVVTNLLSLSVEPCTPGKHSFGDE